MDLKTGEIYNMNKLLATAAAVLALGAPGLASAQGGFIGLSHSTNDDTEIDSTVLSGSTLLGSNFQLDGAYGTFDGGGGDIDGWNIGGHLFSRSGNVLFGGYLGFSSLEDSGESLDDVVVAGQMQYYAGRTTFSGDLSYSQAEFLVDIDTWGVSGEARHFATDNLSFQGNVGYFDAEAEGGGGFDGATYGLGAEWQPDGSPISIYGGWQQVDLDGADSSTLGIGVRWNFAGSLFERNRSGAGLSRPPGFNETLLFGAASPR